MALACVLAGGCGTVRRYELDPVPRAGDGSSPVKIQVRHVEWALQPEDAELVPGAATAVELDLHDADARRSFVVRGVWLVARSVSGGDAVSVPPDTATSSWASGIGLTPGETKTIRLVFNIPESPPVRGFVRLAVVVSVDGQPPLEVAIADPVAGGPRWRQSSPVAGSYFSSSFVDLGSTRNISVIEPFAFAYRRSFGRLVLGLTESWTYIHQDALAAGPPASGLSLLAHVSWQPWHWPVAPYVQAGAFGGAQAPPRAYHGSVDWVGLPRIGAGLLFMGGARLGSAGPLPFERPLSPQHRVGIRIGYARWFNMGTAGGEDGIEFAFELGFHS